VGLPRHELPRPSRRRQVMDAPPPLAHPKLPLTRNHRSPPCRHPCDLSVSTFLGHSVLRTLIRCKFSPPAWSGTISPPSLFPPTRSRRLTSTFVCVGVGCDGYRPAICVYSIGGRQGVHI
jgi:hypothetical protein